MVNLRVLILLILLSISVACGEGDEGSERPLPSNGSSNQNNSTTTNNDRNNEESNTGQYSGLEDGNYTIWVAPYLKNCFDWSRTLCLAIWNEDPNATFGAGNPELFPLNIDGFNFEWLVEYELDIQITGADGTNPQALLLEEVSADPFVSSGVLQTFRLEVDATDPSLQFTDPNEGEIVNGPGFICNPEEETCEKIRGHLDDGARMEIRFQINNFPSHVSVPEGDVMVAGFMYSHSDQ